MLIPGCTEPRDRLIVALDLPTLGKARQLMDELEGIVSFFKVNYQLVLGEGFAFVRDLSEDGKRIFLDLKMDDIDETVIQGVHQAQLAQVKFYTIHGNGATARAAIAGRGNAEFPKILSLTLLSSLDQQDLYDLHILGPRAPFSSLDEYVIWRAKQAIDAGCDGLIASGSSIVQIRQRFGDKPIIVSPAIRLDGTPRDDHKRLMTPRDAMIAGADYVVIGRPIRNADNPSEMARAIVDEIEQGLTAHV